MAKSLLDFHLITWDETLDDIIDKWPWKKAEMINHVELEVKVGVLDPNIWGTSKL